MSNDVLFGYIRSIGNGNSFYIVKNPIIIRLLKEQESLDNIKQYYVKCKNQDEKYQAIQNIYGVITVGQAIIFCHVSFLIARGREEEFF